MTAEIKLYGASTLPTKHAALAAREAIVAELRRTDTDANGRTREGTALVAHAADFDYARAWLARAAEIARAVEARRVTDGAAFVITDDENASLWQAIGNFFRAINVCPYGWKRFRWRMEDLLGGPRNRDERASASLDVSGISPAESEAHLGGPATADSSGGGGIRWLHHYQAGGIFDGSNGPWRWYTDRNMRWDEPGDIVEHAPGIWRRAVIAKILGLNAEAVAAMERPNTTRGRNGPSAQGTQVYFGYPGDIGAVPPGVNGGTAVLRGIPVSISQLQRLPTGESHRTWLFNDGSVFRQPGSEENTPYNDLRVVRLPAEGFRGSDRGTGDRGYQEFMSVWNALRASTVSDPSNAAALRTIRMAPLADLSFSVTHYSGEGASVEDDLVSLQVCPVIAPVEWYWQVFTAPVEGLRAPGDSADISLLDYLIAVGPNEMIREILRDVVDRNLQMLNKRNIQTEAALFGASRLAEAQSLGAAATSQIAADAQESRVAQASVGVATATATAINPIAGVIVGGVGLITLAAVNAAQRSDVTHWVYTDVFGRAMPTWEQFAIHDSKRNLERMLELPEMRPPNGVRSRADAARRLEQSIAEIAAGERFTMDGAAVVGTTLTPTRTERVRTVVLYGLDPVGGARVYADDGVRPWAEREITVAPQESGMAARWQSSAEYGPTWVFGVSDRVPRIRVVYPDGGFRVIALPPAPGTTEEGDAVVTRTPEERTAFVDATPPTSTQDQNTVVVQGMNETHNAEFPPRTVVLVGMQPGTRVFAQGSDVTDAPMLNGDTARWIDSVPGNPGPQGWSFGVSLDNTRVLDLALPDGTRRTLALPALRPGASVTERVTIIDLTGSPASGQYPSRTVVLVGMPQDARVFKGAEDITNIPMLTGDAARWIDSTIGVPGWAFGVPDGTRVIEIVTLSGQRVPVTLPPMDPSLSIEAKVTTVDVRSYFPADTAQAGMGGGGVLLLAGFAAAVAAGYYFKDR
jgi:hypothetical protein